MIFSLCSKHSSFRRGGEEMHHVYMEKGGLGEGSSPMWASSKHFVMFCTAAQAPQNWGRVSRKIACFGRRAPQSAHAHEKLCCGHQNSVFGKRYGRLGEQLRHIVSGKKRDFAWDSPSILMMLDQLCENMTKYVELSTIAEVMLPPMQKLTFSL